MSESTIPRFRWRIIPAFVLFGLSCFVAVLFYNNVVLNDVAVTHPAHFLIFVAGLVWLLGAVFFLRGNWSLASMATIAGFALPFFRTI